MDTTTAPPGSVAASIHARLPELNPAEARIAAVFLELGPDLIYRSVSDVAALADCAISSVVRCCQRLGFKGFHDLKIALSRDPAHPTRTLVDATQAAELGAAGVLQRVAGSAEEAIRYGVGVVDPSAFERVVAILSAARRILIVGVGTSAPLAQDVAYRFVTIGLLAEAPGDVHVQHVRASLLSPADACLAISHTGSTRETVSAAAAACAAGAAVVAVSSFTHSPLSEHAQELLVAASRETTFRVEAMASRVAHLVVLDALYVALALADEEGASASLSRTGDVLAEHRF
ncbi:MAG: MurR/RpiR family transcriptional regulator [Acidimicrobiia bacterium]